MFLRYLEGLLAEDERTTVERLVESSEEASRELQELKNMVHLVRTNERIFCPEPWLISDFLETGRDPSSQIAQHLRECPECREEAEALAAHRKDDRIPHELLSAIKKELGIQAGHGGLEKGRRWLSSLFEMITGAFQSRLALVGAASAAVLLVFLLYPGPSVRHEIALSSITWDEIESDLGGGLLGGIPRAKQRVTTILRLTGDGKPVSREVVDSLYQALTPPKDRLDSYEFVPPAQVKEALAGAHASAGDISTVLKVLRTTLDVQEVVLVTAVLDGRRATIRSDLIDTSTGREVAAGFSATVDRVEFQSKIGAVAYRVLPPSAERGKTRQ